MKKNYNQPKVETVQLTPASIVLAGSPAGIGAGTGGTDNIQTGGSGAPIGD